MTSIYLGIFLRQPPVPRLPLAGMVVATLRLFLWVIRLNHTGARALEAELQAQSHH